MIENSVLPTSAWDAGPTARGVRLTPTTGDSHLKMVVTKTILQITLIVLCVAPVCHWTRCLASETSEVEQPTSSASSIDELLLEQLAEDLIDTPAPSSRSDDQQQSEADILLEDVI